MFIAADLPPDLATPCLVVDGPTVERNIAAAAAYCRRNQLALRPHIKTHKSRRVASLQRAAGAVGLTVAKVGEAECLRNEHDDFLIAYPAADPIRAPRLAHLARACTVRVAVDSLAAVESLAAAAADSGSTLGILVDVDVGFHRTGVQSPQESLELARAVAGHRELRLDGLMYYPGHISPRSADHPQPFLRIADTLGDILDLWSAHGLSATIVSGGSTPTLLESHRHNPFLTEIRPGTYVYNGANEIRAGLVAAADCAARVLATVVSTAVPGKCVVDCGTKTLAADPCGPAPATGFGLVVELPEAKIVRLTEEHGEIELPRGTDPPRLYDRLTLIPNHICPCVNLHNTFWWRDASGRLTSSPVDARGQLV